jgi:Xaa-Pro aminopeptidase
MTDERAPIVLFSRGGDDAEFLYACRLSVEEGLYVRFGDGDDVLAVSTLELDRAREEARARRIVDRRELGWTEQPDRFAAWADVLRRLLGEAEGRDLRVSPWLPAVHYQGLRDLGFRPEIDRGLFVDERRRKAPEEAASIADAQRAAEAACVEVIRLLAAAEVDAEGSLRADGRPLTSERLMAAAHAALHEHGHGGEEMIVAGSPGSALPHFRGAGPILAHAPVIIDIFPRGLASHYHGDLTRTVVPGRIDDRFRRMHDACVEALEAAIATIRAGADGRDVHHAACRTLVARGYGTTTRGFEGDADGPRMNHSTGHGVGLEVHEAPHLRDVSCPLRAGDVVTVEPGLYLTGDGGVRVEDTGMVTSSGFENYTRLPRSLDPRDYL